MIYAARLIGWRLPQVLTQFAQDDDFLEQCGGEIHVHGVAPGRFAPILEKNLEEMRPRWTRYKGYYDPFNTREMKAMYSGRRFCWDVARTKPTERYYRRMNLGAIEAMGQGVVPLVSPALAPEWTFEFAIPCEFDTRNLDPTDITRKLRAVNEDYYKHRERMRQVMLEGPWSYEAVKTQVQGILEVALN